MTLQEKCELSYYVSVAPINEEHGIWLVQHVETKRFFVKKTTRFYNIAVLTYLKEHPVPYMPRILGLYEEAGELTIIEEYLSGDTLGYLLEQHGPYSEIQVASWMKELCVIVHHLHMCTPPIIHRDIKPSNIILGCDGRIRLLDLGTARQSEGSKSQDTVIMGTVGYAAPEQYGFYASSVATDIYAIGALTNKLLTGKLPNEMMYDGALSKIIRRCIQMDPDDRYADIASLDEELCRFLRKHVSSNDETDSVDTAKSIRPIRPKNYLPPGFRSGNILTKLLASAGYFLLFYITLSNTSHPESAWLRWGNRITGTAALLSIVLFSGNYLNCQSLLPLSRSKNPVIRILGIVLWDVVIFFVVIMIAAVVMM